MYKKEIITRGSERKEIQAYFDAHPLGQVDVTIGSERLAILGKLTFPEVPICFQGEEAAVDKVYQAFRIRFMKAGG